MPRREDQPWFPQDFLLQQLDRLHGEGRRVGCQSEVRGLCPFHRETQPSFYVNVRKNVFYCHGGGRGGGPRRFIQLASELLAVPQPERAPAPGEPAAVLEQALAFYQDQLLHHRPAWQYLAQRGVHDPALIAQRGVGYAPGGSLRRYLTRWGYPLAQLASQGLVDAQGRDTLYQRIVFPCRDDRGRLVNLYGRSLQAPPPHRLLPGSKGGLFAWSHLCQASPILLVEGLFDLAVLWQQGFGNTTCALGTHLTPTQFSQLCQLPGRQVAILFDHDHNGAGSQAAVACARRLAGAGLIPYILSLPPGHDPSSYCAAGATAADFARLWEAAA